MCSVKGGDQRESCWAWKFWLWQGELITGDCADKRCCWGPAKAGYFSREREPGAEGNPFTGHALTNEVLPHRVWIQQAETSAGKKTHLQPQTLSKSRPGSSQRVPLGAAGNRAGDRAIPWVQRPSGRQSQSQATTYVQGAWTGERLLTVQVHGPLRRQGWRQAQLQRGSGRDQAGLVGHPR